MNKLFTKVLLINMLFGCASGLGSKRPTPERKCSTTLYLIEGKFCITYLDGDDEITKCNWDNDFPKDLTALTLKDYNCERNYQDELLKELKKRRRR